MKRIMTLVTAVIVMMAGFAAVDAATAEAGLFNRGNDCCQPQRRGLFHRHHNDCCEPVCQPVCEPVCQPTCCEPAPTCCAPAPTCCEAPACGGCGHRHGRKARRGGCCAAPSCCGAVDACGSCGGAAVSGCSDCGGVPVGGAPAPAPAGAPPEAAPEAPAAPEGEI